MTGRKPTGPWIVRQSSRRSRPAVADQHAEMPTLRGALTDRGLELWLDPDGDELLEPRAGLVDHAERAVARTSQLDGGLDHLLQERLERELGAERDPRLE